MREAQAKREKNRRNALTQEQHDKEDKAAAGKQANIRAATASNPRQAPREEHCPYNLIQKRRICLAH